MIAKVLASSIGAQISSGDSAREISGVANLEEAQSHHLAPFTDGQYAAQLKASKAGAILTNAELGQSCAGIGQ